MSDSRKHISSSADVERVEKSLRRHLMQMERMLDDRKRDELESHHSLVVSLRALLCDKFPILLRYAEYRGTVLKVWGPYPSGFRPDPDVIAFSFNALVASWNPVRLAHELTIEEYLLTPIGAVPTFSAEDSTPRTTIWYTPRDLIRWLADTEAAHLDLLERNDLRQVKDMVTVSGRVEMHVDGVADSITVTDDFVLRAAIIQIARWTVSALRSLTPSTGADRRDVVA